MKLELKHLAPYLPYGLKIKWANGGTYGVFFDEQIDFQNDLYPLCSLVFSMKRQDSDPLGWKMILRPLSDLTKEIEHNGDEFVPIRELLLMQGVMTEAPWYNTGQYGPGSNFGIVAVQFWIKWATEDSSKMFVYEPEASSFYFESEQAESTVATFQLEMFEKLFEWHFDVFGLIENGLAIDINTLELTPSRV